MRPASPSRSHGRHRAPVLLLALALLVVLAPPWGPPSARAVEGYPAGAGGGGPFGDVAGTLHQGAVDALEARGDAPACATGRYCPAEPATRAEVAAVLARGLRLDAGAVRFSDVGEGHVYRADIAAVAADNITVGCAPGTRRFCPERSVTRAEVAAMVDRALPLPAAPEQFRDVPGDAWYGDAAGALVAAGISRGCTAERFCPRRAVTRGELAAFVVRADRAGVRPAAPPAAPATTAARRDPLLWPYAWDAIWNMPLGSRAALVDAGLPRPTGRTLTVEEDLLFLPGDATTTRRVQAHDAGWRSGVTRCGERTGSVLPGLRVPVPAGFRTDPGYFGTRPNHATAIVNPDMTLSETQPLHVCRDGTVVSQHDSARWQGDSVLTGGQGDAGGSHGGSSLTAFGGTIRLGEWVPGGRIPHALKILVDAAHLSRTREGHRWPALLADRGYRTTYTGDVPAMRMGSLLTLPGSFDVAGLDHGAARVLARALTDHGAYVVDVTGWDTVAFATEWSPRGRVTEEFAATWGFPLHGRASRTDGRQASFLRDVERIVAALHVVDDNRPGRVGGAGPRVAPYAPALQDGTGGVP